MNPLRFLTFYYPRHFILLRLFFPNVFETILSLSLSHPAHAQEENMYNFFIEMTIYLQLEELYDPQLEVNCILAGPQFVQMEPKDCWLILAII